MIKHDSSMIFVVLNNPTVIFLVGAIMIFTCLSILSAVCLSVEPFEIWTRLSLRKHTYLNILKILPPKKFENFQINSDIFFIFLLT